MQEEFKKIPNFNICQKMGVATDPGTPHRLSKKARKFLFFVVF